MKTECFQRTFCVIEKHEVKELVEPNPLILKPLPGVISPARARLLGLSSDQRGIPEGRSAVQIQKLQASKSTLHIAADDAELHHRWNFGNCGLTLLVFCWFSSR